MSFGDRVKEARRGKGYTQEELAKLIGVAKTTLTGYEKGNREPDISKIKDLIKHLEINPNFLLEIENNLPDYPSTPFDKYCSLDVHGKEVINAVLEKEYERICQKKKVATYPVKPDFTEIETEEAEETEEIRLYNQAAGAGIGTTIDDDAYELINMPVSKIPRGAEYCVKISGDSMEPTIYDGDIVFIKPTPQLEDDEIGVFFQDGDMYCKRLEIDYDARHAYLVSDNEKYKPIKINEDCLTIGKVLLPKS